MLLNNVDDYTTENSVKIWDGLFEESMLEDIYSLREKPLWEFTNGHPPKKSWCIDICNFGLKHKKFNSVQETIDSYADSWETICKDFPFVPIVWNKMKTLTPYNLKIARTWINGHTYALGDQIHSDQEDGDWKLEGYKGITWLLYCNPLWGPDAGGETKIYTKNGDILRSVAAYPGRLIAFDPRLLHKGECPNRYNPDLRMTLAFHTRFKGEINDEEI